MIEKPNRARERKGKNAARRDLRHETAEVVFKRDRYRCINPDCPHSKDSHSSGLDRHHGLKRRPHNRDLENPKWSVTLCSGSGGCHDKTENDPKFLIGVLREIERSKPVVFHYGDLLAELEKKEKR